MIKVLIHIVLCLCILFPGGSPFFCNPTCSIKETPVAFSKGTQIVKEQRNNPKHYHFNSKFLFIEEEETKESVKDEIKVISHFIAIVSDYDASVNKYVSLVNSGSSSFSIPLYLLNSVFIL